MPQLAVTASATTSRSREGVFRSLVAAPPLRWIEAPWTVRTEEALSSSKPLAWYLSNGRRIVTDVEVNDEEFIRWRGSGITGEVLLAGGDEGTTTVSYSGRFPLGGGLSMLVMKGNMSRLASEATQSNLRRFLG